jgi:arabinofuranosyltransferase
MNQISHRAWRLLSIVVVCALAAMYLASASSCQGLGFPLDDGWIHQTYARNLAQTGRLQYGEGLISTGSTSPLWTSLLSLGYLLALPPLPWTYVLGGVSWLLTGWAAAALTARLYPGQATLAPWVGLACLLEWHLAWAALSGMETALSAFLSLLLIERYASGARPLVVGLVGGLLVLTRPEGILLVGLLGGSVLWVWAKAPGDRRWVEWRSTARALLGLTVGLALLLAPYVALNQAISGQPFPNTYYAKQTEYRALLAQPIWRRLWIVLRRPLVGGQVLLLPGLVWQVATTMVGRPAGSSSARSPASSRLLPLAWCAIYFLVYALRLPVDYQYGRYLMPTIPFLLMFGLVGTAGWLQPRSRHAVARILSRAAVVAIVALFVAFLSVGRQAYVQDVCVINGEMVDVARWLGDNTASDSLIAAHDIGAIGYFADRPLLDLAGLVTPEVIPFMREERQLLDFVLRRGADYVVTFPSWYPRMVTDDRLEIVYQTDCPITLERGGDNMAVYQVQH